MEHWVFADFLADLTYGGDEITKCYSVLRNMLKKVSDFEQANEI